jgi:hypothetical protein
VEFTLPVIKEPLSSLPDPFLSPQGERISDKSQWPKQREYLKEMLSHYLYGHMPPSPGNTKGQVVSSTEKYNSQAIVEEIHATCGPGDALAFEFQVIRPSKEGKFPVFVWIAWEGKDHPCEYETVVERGYAIARIDIKYFAPDDVLAYKNAGCGTLYPEYDWKALAMWAWGQSRVADYLESTPWASALIATGHSRYGKASACAGIFDERFQISAIAGAGCGGVSTLRYIGGRLGEGIGSGEQMDGMSKAFPHWVSQNIHDFDGHKLSFLPIDGNLIRSLIAPRAVISTDGLDDSWANPFGVQVAWLASQPVFDLLEVSERNAMYFREGGHAYDIPDWNAVLDFCDNILFGKEPPPFSYKLYSPKSDPAPLYCDWIG